MKHMLLKYAVRAKPYRRIFENSLLNSLFSGNPDRVCSSRSSIRETYAPEIRRPSQTGIGAFLKIAC
jgi:hypothetical protein